MVYTISDGPATKKLKQGVSDGVMTITIRGSATTIREQSSLRYGASAYDTHLRCYEDQGPSLTRGERWLNLDILDRLSKGGGNA